MPHTISGSHLINGQWVRPSDAKTFIAKNPATGENLSPEFVEAGETEVNAALTAASEAFEQTRDLPHGWQAKLLDAITARIMDLGDALLERGELETALPRGRMIVERARTCGQLQLFAELVREGSWVDATIDTADPNRTPFPKPDVRRMFRPRGPVVVFGASNFPFAFSVCGGDTASALAAGNPVVAKGHPSHPGTSELFAGAVLSALNDLKLPPGLFAVVQGTTNEFGAALVKHPNTTAVGFTGSQRGGRALFDLAAARPRPIPVYAEMGSLNPFVILPGALREKADEIAQGLAFSILIGGGQFCTKPGLILTLGDSDKLIDILAKTIEAAPAVTMLNQPLCRSFFDRVSDWPHFAGVKVRVAPKPSGWASVSPGLFEISADSFNHQSSLNEEAFGPAAVVVRCDDLEDIKLALDRIGGSLTATMHIGASDEPSMVKTISRELESIAGRVVVNGYPTGVEVNHAIVHGGPYPATTDPGSTSVGSAAIRRFVRMIAFQDSPDALLPAELQNSNPLGILRTVNGKHSRDRVAKSE